MHADLLLTNAQLLTIAPQPAGAETVACWRGRILAVGPTALLAPLRSTRTEVIDLGGRLLLPGFWDCHLHLVWYGLLRREWLDLRGARNVEEARQRLRQFAERQPKGLVYGQGFNKNEWPADAFPAKADLDVVVADRPVILDSKDGHASWCNSAALAAAGVTRETADPPTGKIERDASGEPTGILLESAQALAAKLIPEQTIASRQLAIADAQAELHARGVVGVHNCEATGELQAIQQMARSGKLALRVVHHLQPDTYPLAPQLGMYPSFGSDWVRLGSVKCFLDGSLGSQTAALLEPYATRPGYAGIPTMTQEQFWELASAASPGFGLAVHAIGDRANRIALDTFQRLQSTGPRPAPRQRIEHAQHLAPEDIPRFAELGVVASMQPLHLLADMAVAEKHLGPERCRGAYAFGSLLRHGAHVCFGSDAPVEEPDPLRGLHAAVTRQRPDGDPPGGWQPQERISVLQALRCHTVEAAYAAGLEALSGSIEEGKWADLVALSADITHATPEEILAATVDLTVVAGQVVHATI